MEENKETKHYNRKWAGVLNGKESYHFDKRQASYNLVCKLIEPGSRVFDFACGLGKIAIMLDENCDVCGCDISDVAIYDVRSKVKKPWQFEIGDQIQGEYDYIIASHILEHMEKPVDWVKDNIIKCRKMIIVLPNNCRRQGEHENMAWCNWDEFKKMFADFLPEEVGGYKEDVPSAFRSKIFIFKGEKG